MIPNCIFQTNALKLVTINGLVASQCVIFLPGQLGIFSLIVVGFANSIMWGVIWTQAITD